MAISLLGGFLGGILATAVSLYYPLYLTGNFLLDYVAKKSKGSVEVDNTAIHYLAYWMLYSLVLLVESTTIYSIFSGVFPFYYELRTALFYWLVSPQFRGAGWLFVSYLIPAVENFQPKVSEEYIKMCPPQVKAVLEKVLDACASNCDTDSTKAAFSNSREPSTTN